MNADDFPLYHYRAEVVRCLDGDTIAIRVRLGFNVEFELHTRIAAINAPELGGATAAEGAASRDALTRLLFGTIGVVPTVYVVSIKDRMSYERYLANVYLPTAGGELLDVGAWMVEHGFATPRPIT